MAIRLPLLLLTTALLLQACASPGPPPDFREPECRAWYQALDRRIEAAGQRDAGARPVPGYPWLRADRFLASYAAPLPEGELWRWWIDAMAELDRHTRSLALQRLDATDATDPVRLADCNRALSRATRALPAAARRKLAGQVRVPDHYVGWQQALGLYPIPALIALTQIDKLHEELARPFGLPPAELPGHDSARQYGPAADFDPAGLRSASTGLPPGAAQLDDRQLAELVRRHAPLLSVATRNDKDRIGRVALDDGRPSIRTDQPAAYVYFSRSRFHDQAWLQINYLFWFPARDTDDIYGGALDALIWRVSLDADLRPAAYDSIHACGCYYLLFPGPGYRSRPTPPGAEPVLSPTSAPALAAGQRLRLHLAAATHYLQQIEVAPSDASADDRYRLLDYDRLRVLDTADGRRSLFDQQGLVPASRRPERFLLWPLGVRSAGAMRQAGTHAIAFVGRRHFDDARLLETLIEERRP